MLEISGIEEVIEEYIEIIKIHENNGGNHTHTIEVD